MSYLTLIRALIFIWIVNCNFNESFQITTINHNHINHFKQSSINLYGIPKERIFQPQQIEILRVLGRVDIITDSQSTMDMIGNEISIRIFEARLIDGTKCFMKEYSPSGMTFGKREQNISRKLITKWNQIRMDAKKTKMANQQQNNVYNNKNTINHDNEEEDEDTDNNNDDDEIEINNDTTTTTISTTTIINNQPILSPPYFPILLGSLITDLRIESEEFRYKWRQRFPSIKPPESGNLWLIFQWSDATFRNLRRYPPLPQIIEGLDYFNKKNRVKKRWLFIRKIIRLCLELIDKLHRQHGYCHNTISSECIWLSTTNQLEIQHLYVVLSELGSCQKLKDLGPYAKKGILQDLYSIGFVVLELIASSFVDDNLGAQKVRAMLAGKAYYMNIVARVEEMDYSQLRKNEWQQVFEVICDYDFQRLREFVRSISDYREVSGMLEADDGFAWRLIFYLLASGSGRLFDEDKENPLTVTARSVLREFTPFFSDTY